MCVVPGKLNIEWDSVGCALLLSHLLGLNRMQWSVNKSLTIGVRGMMNWKFYEAVWEGKASF